MKRNVLSLALAAGMLPVLAIAATAGTVIDPHQVYEQKCGGCHFEHGADLARQKLAIAGGAVTLARTGKPIETVLARHHGVTLKEVELRAIVDLFRKGITWGGVFQHRCATCHHKAAEFAREHLEMVDGKLVTRQGRDVEALLAHHGEATAAEIATLTEMLEFQLRTAPKP